MSALSWLRLFLHTPVLWGIIQVLSLYTYIRYTPQVRSYVNRWAFQVSSSFHAFFHWLRRPWIALARVEELEVANAELMEALANLPKVQGPVSYPVGAWGDVSFMKNYKLHPVEVIYQTLHIRENFAILNQGGRAGIYPGLGVLSPKGAVGIIAETTATHSVMYALFHKDVHLSASLPRQQVMGLTSWKEPVLNRLLLEYVPLYVSVSVGDEVWTAPNSILFPAGIRIGQVKKVNTDFTRGFHAIEVATYTDWHALGPLYVLVPLSSAPSP
ncbi:MAG: rod shape-determining protein MreC [Bacteroidia bacterium]|nr:rod shape-determining protein MreC [Bacteroidia bacterium]